jgi:protein TonB
MKRPTQVVEHSVAEPTNVVQEIVQQEAIVAESVFQTRDALAREVAQERPPVVPQDLESHAKAEKIQQVVANEAYTGAVEPIIRAPVTEDLAAAIVENFAVRHKQPTAIPQETTSAPAMQTARVEPRQERRVEARPSGQADFGWLVESLWRRIESLKRYPSVARARRWEGKVVVEAIIRHDGEILDCHIAESSGHGVLDQDALSVLRRASPLPLKHPLGRPQITILLPITYRLHG